MVRSNQRVTALIFKNDKILLIRRFKDNQWYWTVPGGSVEAGESLETALKREVLEETSLKVISFKPVFETNLVQFGRVCHFFICTVSGTPRLGDGPEKENSSSQNRYILKWVTMRDLPSSQNLYPPASAEILQAYDNQS